MCFQQDTQSKTTNISPPIFQNVALEFCVGRPPYFSSKWQPPAPQHFGRQESLPSLVQSECNSPERHANGSSGLPSSVGVWGVVPNLGEIEWKGGLYYLGAPHYFVREWLINDVVKAWQGLQMQLRSRRRKAELRDFVGTVFVFSFGGVLFFFSAKFLWVTLVQYLFVSFFHWAKSTGWTLPPNLQEGRANFHRPKRQVFKRHPSPNPPGKCLQTVRVFRGFFFCWEKCKQKNYWDPIFSPLVKLNYVQHFEPWKKKPGCFMVYEGVITTQLKS